MKKNIKFEDFVAKGENPRGVVMQNANGTIIEGRGGDGFQYNFGVEPDGARWNHNPMPNPDTVSSSVFGILATPAKRKK